MLYIYIVKKMQKKFVIIDNDQPLNDLIEEQVSIVFEKSFNIKFSTQMEEKLSSVETERDVLKNFYLIKAFGQIII